MPLGRLGSAAKRHAPREFQMIGDFENRADAGRQLGAVVHHLRLIGRLVLALPRGGVPVGAEVALALHAPLNLLIDSPSRAGRSSSSTTASLPAPRCRGTSCATRQSWPRKAFGKSAGH